VIISCVCVKSAINSIIAPVEPGGVGGAVPVAPYGSYIIEDASSILAPVAIDNSDVVKLPGFPELLF
jgi:hypothetical protein